MTVHIAATYRPGQPCANRPRPISPTEPGAERALAVADSTGARDHVFLKGHRIMVQIQSTWFPLIDRNPQTFTPSIYTAKAGDYPAATQRVYSSPKMPSHVMLQSFCRSFDHFDECRAAVKA